MGGEQVVDGNSNVQIGTIQVYQSALRRLLLILLHNRSGAEPPPGYTLLNYSTPKASHASTYDAAILFLRDLRYLCQGTVPRSLFEECFPSLFPLFSRQALLPIAEYLTPGHVKRTNQATKQLQAGIKSQLASSKINKDRLVAASQEMFAHSPRTRQTLLVRNPFARPSGILLRILLYIIQCFRNKYT